MGVLLDELEWGSDVLSDIGSFLFVLDCRMPRPIRSRLHVSPGRQQILQRPIKLREARKNRVPSIRDLACFRQYYRLLSSSFTYSSSPSSSCFDNTFQV